jgi:hypothetical protein
MGLFDCFRCKALVFLKHDVFFPGNVVEGYIELDASSDIEVVGVRVKLCGKEKTEVTRSMGNSRHTYWSTAVVLKQLVTLAGNMKSTKNREHTVIPKGKYTYPFLFQLPMNLPPSFHRSVADGDSATILYYVKAYVDIPKGRDVASKRHFKVLCAIPHRQWAAPNPMTRTQHFDVKLCCCYSKGAVEGHFWMDRTLIAIDRDSFTVCVDVDNTHGEEPVESLEVTLLNILTYTAGGHTDTNRVSSGRNYIKQRVEKGQKGRIQGVIPVKRDIVPTCTGNNMSSRYVVRIELNIPWASDPVVDIPVIVSHVVDESNTLPPVEFERCTYRALPSNEFPEFFYYPPAVPVYTYAPIPTFTAPAGAPMYYSEGQPTFAVLPPQSCEWGATGFSDPAQPAVHWAQGVPMTEMPGGQLPAPLGSRQDDSREPIMGVPNPETKSFG